MQELRVLYIEDDPENREELKDALSGEALNNCVITLDCEESFENAAKRVQGQNYHLVIIDLMKGSKDMGSEIYNQIRSVFFTPIIFYSAKTAGVESLKSQVIGVASKFDGIDALKAEIDRLTKHGLPLLREKVHHFVEKEFKHFFWDTIQNQNNIFKAGEEDFSLSYLLLRRFANSLSKENIRMILNDDSIINDKVHPMEFYIYPVDSNRPFENGEIVQKKGSDEIFVILTPSCDFVERLKKGVSQGCRAENVLLTQASPLSSITEYQKFVDTQNNENRQALIKLIGAQKGDRYFFLPATPFLDNMILDFQNSNSFSLSELKENFNRIAKLDDPFSQAMMSSFIRYFDRIGFPDIDSEYILGTLSIKK